MAFNIVIFSYTCLVSVPVEVSKDRDWRQWIWGPLPNF